MAAPPEQEKSFTGQNGGCTCVEDRFLSPFVQRRRNGPPSADQGFSTAKPRGSHAVCIPQVHPPTFPCPALSAGAESKSQGHCQK